MPLYTPFNVVMAVATVRREISAPLDASRPDVKVQIGQRVTPDDTVLQVSQAGRFHTILIPPALRVRRALDVQPDWLKVTRGEVLTEGQTIAMRGRRGPQLRAPIDCVVVDIDAAQVVLQDKPEPINVHPPYPGQVTAIGSQGTVQIESVGALLQCAWGNGRRAFGAYLQEPDGGLRPINDVLAGRPLRGQLLWINRRLTPADLKTIEQHEIIGVIAPGMPSALMSAARAAPFAICLTEGFGTQQHSDLVFSLLRDNLGRQITIDGVLLDYDPLKRAELFIAVRAGGLVPPAPYLDRPLGVGAGVRMAREPYSGLTGQIEQVAETPQIVDNELRLPGAVVRLKDGQRIFVPAANLELLGQTLDTGNP